MNRSRFVSYLRTLEVLYRSDGHYESAVQAQMTADCCEAEDAVERRAPLCSWFQRGINRVPEVFVLDGMLGVELVNGMVHYLTYDAAIALWASLTYHLKLTGADLRQAARRLDEAKPCVDYDEKPFTPATKDPP